VKRSLTLLLFLLALAGLTLPVPAHGDDEHEGHGPPRALLQKIFPTAQAFVPHKLSLSPAARARIEKTLGEHLEGHDLTASLYVPTQGGRSAGLAWMTDAHLAAGKSADVVVGVDLKGRVVGVQLAHSPVASLAAPSFLDQFRGKTGTSSFAVKPPAGQAAASKEVAKAARKATLILGESLKR